MPVFGLKRMTKRTETSICTWLIPWCGRLPVDRRYDCKGDWWMPVNSEDLIPVFVWTDYRGTYCKTFPRGKRNFVHRQNFQLGRVNNEEAIWGRKWDNERETCPAHAPTWQFQMEGGRDDFSLVLNNNRTNHQGPNWLNNNYLSKGPLSIKH